MATIDIIILCCFLPAIFLGLKNGLVKQIVSLLVIFLGITLSLRFSGKVSEWIIPYITVSDKWIKVISFTIIFIAVALLLNIIGQLIEKVVKITLLGWVNRLLGMAFAFAWTLLILCTIAYFIDTLNTSVEIISNDKLESSIFFPYLLEAANNIFPYLKTLF
ncbi:MAG: CvpA family protein [Bacteroidales bacterium]|nr:CvpA family protein [Bacteroidales bacterium]